MELPVFQRPEYLWLLALAPVFLIGRRSSSRLRGALIRGVRLVLFALVVVALAQPAFRKRSDAVTTFFVLDRSGSVPESMKAWSLDVVRQSVAAKANKDDRAGMVVFGEQGIVEESPTPNFNVSRLFSVVDGAQTDIAAALRLALSSFPDDTQKRIVLFTDGNETKGDLTAAIQRAVAAGCPVDVVPLKYHYKDEVLVESLSLPPKVQRDEPFQVRTNVVSLGDAKGTMRLFCDGQIVAERPVSLQEGDNVFLFSHALKDPGFHLFEAEIAGERDGILENNRAQAYSIIEDQGLVLLAAGSPDDVKDLAPALQQEGISYRVRTAGALPRDLGEWQSYDAIVFANLGAEHVTLAQMEMIESLVKDLGAGFVMIGGEKSFGAGGYFGTPIARVLPVDLDVTQSQVLPNGGIALILDHIHCIGDRWTKDICGGTLNALTAYDGFGVLVGGRADWPIPLAPASNKPAIMERINGLVVGDIADVDSYLGRAIDAFQSTRYSYRHAVIVTDGSLRVPGALAIARLRAARMTLSIVLIEPRVGDYGPFREAARLGGGNFYVVQPHERNLVPQIFIKESAIVKKGLFFEERFTPALKENSEILEGIGAKEIPALAGYNVSTKKDPTEIPLVSNHGDPILAHWHCGLGKAVAFTSDASTRWGADWVAWDKYRRFWSQAVRWCQRRIPASPYHLTIQRGRREGTVEAIIDAQDEKGQSVNFLTPSGTMVNPDLKSAPLSFEQVGPGRYRATFRADRQGPYVVNVQYAQDGAPYLLRGGYVPPYNPEYQKFEHDEALLLSIADQTRGRMMAPGMNFFAPTGEIAYTTRPVWPLLLLVAACLFPLDVFVRRVVVGWRDVADLFRRKQDPVKDALLAEREAMKARAAWEPSRPAVEGVASEAAPASVEGPAEVEPGELEATKPLWEAKRRARKKMDKE